MYPWPAFTLFILLVACTSDNHLLTEPLKMIPAAGSIGSEKIATVNQEQIVKSPQGYVINGPKDRFGGFIGDCSSDENFPYYWECQAESAGDNFH
jgi:hypothetical protein